MHWPIAAAAYVGVYAPILLFLISLLVLRNMPNYLYYFVFGFIVNNVLNVCLKLAIKDARPLEDQKAIEIAVVHGQRIGFDKFGMPSGHAQNCGYCLSFVVAALNSPGLCALYSVITLATLLQRYMYRNHTAMQLVVGVLIGLGMGYYFYCLGNDCITGNKAIKKDDFGPP